jgi:hypothetical protein
MPKSIHVSPTICQRALMADKDLAPKIVCGILDMATITIEFITKQTL